MKRDAEIESKRVKSAAERASSLWSTLKSWFGYLVILIVILAFAGPPLVVNLVRNEIAKGEWTHLEQAPADVVDLGTPQQ